MNLQDFRDAVWEFIDNSTYWLTIAAAIAFLAGVGMVWRIAADVRAVRIAVEAAASPAAAGDAH